MYKNIPDVPESSAEYAHLEGVGSAVQSACPPDTGSRPCVLYITIILYTQKDHLYIVEVLNTAVHQIYTALRQVTVISAGYHRLCYFRPLEYKTGHGLEPGSSWRAVILHGITTTSLPSRKVALAALSLE